MATKFSIVSEGFEGDVPVDRGEDSSHGHVKGADESIRSLFSYLSSSRQHTQQDGKQPHETPTPRGGATSVELDSVKQPEP